MLVLGLRLTRYDGDEHFCFCFTLARGAGARSCPLVCSSHTLRVARRFFWIFFYFSSTQPRDVAQAQVRWAITITAIKAQYHPPVKKADQPSPTPSLGSSNSNSNVARLPKPSSQVDQPSPTPSLGSSNSNSNVARLPKPSSQVDQ